MLVGPLFPDLVIDGTICLNGLRVKDFGCYSGLKCSLCKASQSNNYSLLQFFVVLIAEFGNIVRKNCSIKIFHSWDIRELLTNYARMYSNSLQIMHECSNSLQIMHECSNSLQIMTECSNSLQIMHECSNSLQIVHKRRNSLQIMHEYCNSLQIMHECSNSLQIMHEL